MPEKMSFGFERKVLPVRELTLEGTVNKRGVLVDLGDSIQNMIQYFLSSPLGSCKHKYTHRTT
jgi:hypothetical protein